MTTELTVVAYADAPGIKVERLLWSLATRRPCDLQVVLADLTEEGDPDLALQLRLYRSAFPARLVRPGGHVRLGSLTSGSVLVLPASAVPYRDAVSRMVRQGTCSAPCRQPGPLCAAGMDDLGANLTRDLVDDCPHSCSDAWAMTERDWRAYGRDHTWSQCEADFVLYPPPNRGWRPNPDLGVDPCS